jgi:hypothetical protein
MFERTKSAYQKFARWYQGLRWLNKRVFWVGVILVPIWLATFYWFYFMVRHGLVEPTELIVEVTIAWSGELLFFTAVGLLVTYLTLQDPREGTLDDRIRILIGETVIPSTVSNYIKGTLSKFSAYVEHAKREVVVESYNDHFNAYRVRVTTTYQYRNPLRDSLYDEPLSVRVSPDTFASGAGPTELGRVTSIRIDGAEKMTSQLPIEPNGFQTDLRLKMAKGGQSLVVFKYWVWMKVDVLQTMTPSRVIEVFGMEITSECDQLTARLKIERDKGGPKSMIYGQPVTFDQIQGISPGEKIFEFCLLPPA